MNSDNPQSDLLQQTALANSTATVEALRKEVRTLRSVVTVSLLGLVITSVGLNLFVWRQMSLVSNQAAENQRVIEDYRRVSQSVIGDFLTKLQGYAAANPDFRPILQKYLPAQTSAPPAKAPAPAKGTRK